jgi:transposase
MYKEVRVKDLDSHAVKALLVSRALLVKIKRISRTKFVDF